MKHSTPECMKFKRLQRRLKESKRGIVGLLELLWISTQNNAKRGDIGRISNEEIAIDCDWEGDPDELVDALVDCGWIDLDSTHRLIIHDWNIHSPNWVKGTVKEHLGGFLTPSLDPVLDVVLDPSPETQSKTLSLDPGPENRVHQVKSSQVKPNQVKSSERGSQPPAVSPSDVIEAWNAEFGSRVNLTQKRSRTIAVRLNDAKWRNNWLAALKKIRGSPFLTGTNDRSWKADIDFFIKPDSVIKIIEGKYDGSKQNGKQVRGGHEFAAETL